MNKKQEAKKLRVTAYLTEENKKMLEQRRKKGISASSTLNEALNRTRE